MRLAPRKGKERSRRTGPGAFRHDFDILSATVIQIQALQAAENAGISEIYRQACRVQRDGRLSEPGRAAKVADQLNSLYDILDHYDEGAWVWDFRSGERQSPGTAVPGL